MRTPIRYALWSMLAIAPAFIILPIFCSSLAEAGGAVGPRTGLLAMLATAIAAGITATIAPGIVRPESRTVPGWSIIGMTACFAQIALAILLDIDGPANVWTGAYVPGALVCLNVLALILIHVWVASVGMGFSPAVGLLTGSAYGAWVFRVGCAQTFDAFMGVSGIAFGLSFIVACAVALRGGSSASAPAPSVGP